MESLRIGNKYEVIFQGPHRPMVLVGFYLGEGFGGLMFDLRPVAGTTAVRKRDFITAIGVSKGLMLPRSLESVAS